MVSGVAISIGMGGMKNTSNNAAEKSQSSNKEKAGEVEKYLSQGNKALTDKKYDEAIKNYEEVLKIDSKNFEAYAQVAVAYMNLNKYDKALENLNKALALQTSNFKIYKLIGDCQAKLNKDDLAIGAYQKAVELNQGKDAFAYPELINLLIKNKKNEESIKYLKEFENISSKSIKIANDPNNATVYKTEAQLYLSLKDYNNAIAACKKAVEAYDKDSTTYRIMGDIYIQTKDYDSAIASYNKAVDLKTNDADLYYNMAYCFMQQQKYDEAIKSYDGALRINPNYENAAKYKEMAIKAKGGN
jgi:tetratricopeptide (TPR) repeat protein